VNSSRLLVSVPRFLSSIWFQGLQLEAFQVREGQTRMVQLLCLAASNIRPEHKNRDDCNQIDKCQVRETRIALSDRKRTLSCGIITSILTRKYDGSSVTNNKTFEPNNNVLDILSNNIWIKTTFL
jgi:hypothetical protein